MLTIDYIINTIDKLTRKYDTRDPYALCDALGVTIREKDLGTQIKAYYFYQSRIRNIVLNSRVSEAIKRILLAHELGHDRLHKEIAMLRGFQEIDLFDMTSSTEYEANIFAAELLIEDEMLFEMFNDTEASFFGIAKMLEVPAALLDFKFRIFKQKGFRINAPYIANGDFLKTNIDGYFEDNY